MKSYVCFMLVLCVFSILLHWLLRCGSELYVYYQCVEEKNINKHVPHNKSRKSPTFMEVNKVISSAIKPILNYQRNCNGEILNPKTYCNNETLGKKNQKLLTYSLFGKGVRWGKSSLQYIETIPILSRTIKHLEFFADWKMRIYHDGGEFSSFAAKNLSYLDNVEFCNTPCLQTVNLANVLGTFFRTAALADPNVDVLCSRDLDAIITYRESMAVKEWYEGDKLIHLMRDNPMHVLRMLGGMWCFRSSKAGRRRTVLQKEIQEHAKTVKGTDDQGILNSLFWKHFDFPKDVVQHDSYACERFEGSLPFPVQRQNLEFIGCDKIPCMGTKGKIKDCPLACRPPDHKEWIKC